MRTATAAAALLACLLLAGCGGGRSAAPSAPAKRGLFDYNRSAPLRLQDRGLINHGYPVGIRDVSYASPRGGRVPAYLVIPPVRGRRPAVIFMHGSGGSRDQFLLPAVWMAARGAVGLTITSPFDRQPRPAIPRGVAGLERQRKVTAKNVVELRRAVDVLRSLPYVDGSRIAYVGWSAGARTGALLAGVDHRIRFFDLISGGATPVSGYAAAAPPRLRKAVTAALAPVDPLRLVRHAAPSALFFQDGRTDEVVPRAALLALFRTASRPKLIRWYDSGHAPSPKAYHDLLGWVSARLGLHGVIVRRVETGP